MVIEGEAIAEIDGVQHHLKADDTTWIPANVPHRFINASDKPMRIFWTYATIEATRTMVASGEMRTIDAEHVHAPEAPMTDHVFEIAEITVTDPAGFEAGVIKARPHFLAAAGCLGLALRRVIETPGTYRLVVKWRTVEDHMVTFRASEGFAAWRAAVSPYFAGPPVVTRSRAIDLD